MAQANTVSELKTKLMEAAFHLDSNEPLVGVSLLVPLAAEVAATPPKLRKKTLAAISEVLRVLRLLCHGDDRGYRPSTIDSTACGYRWAGVLILRQMRKNLAPISIMEESAEIVPLHSAQRVSAPEEQPQVSSTG
jgi:hypothetical protein